MDLNKNLTLADIIRSAYKNWLIIVITTLTFGSLMFLYARNSKPNYKTSSTLFLDFNKSIDTRFGKYAPENINSKDFLRLIKSENVISQTISENGLSIKTEDFADRLNVVYPEYEASNSVTLELVLSDSNVNVILGSHISNFLDGLKKYHQTKAIKYFKLILNRGLLNLNRRRNQIKELIPIKDSSLNAMSPTNFNSVQLKQLKQQGFDVSVDDFWSPEYTALSSQLIKLKSELLEVEYKINDHNEFLKEIESVENKITTENIMDSELYYAQEYVTRFLGTSENEAIELRKSTYKFALLGLFIGFVFSIFIILIIILNKKNSSSGS